MQAVVKLDSDFHLGVVNGKRPTYRENAERALEVRIDRAYKEWREELHQNYLRVCILRRGLYKRYLAGEEELEEVVDRLDMLLDDFTGEEARAWQIAITPYIQKNIS